LPETEEFDRQGRNSYQKKRKRRSGKKKRVILLFSIGKKSEKH